MVGEKGSYYNKGQFILKPQGTQSHLGVVRGPLFVLHDRFRVARQPLRNKGLKVAYYL